MKKQITSPLWFLRFTATRCRNYRIATYYNKTYISLKFDCYSKWTWDVDTFLVHDDIDSFIEKEEYVWERCGNDLYFYTWTVDGYLSFVVDERSCINTTVRLPQQRCIYQPPPLQRKIFSFPLDVPL
jgi:hypothetical protein